MTPATLTLADELRHAARFYATHGERAWAVTLCKLAHAADQASPWQVERLCARVRDLLSMLGRVTNHGAVQ